MSASNKVTEGDLVLYVLPESETCRSAGEFRPAFVVKVWSEDVVNLQVFVDYSNDFRNQAASNTGTLWATSVTYDEGKTNGTWHLKGD